jgi:hypothetical protein
LFRSWFELQVRCNGNSRLTTAGLVIMEFDVSIKSRSIHGPQPSNTGWELTFLQRCFVSSSALGLHYDASSPILPALSLDVRPLTTTARSTAPTACVSKCRRGAQSRSLAHGHSEGVVSGCRSGHLESARIRRCASSCSILRRGLRRHRRCWRMRGRS